MANPDFGTWNHETLIQFATDAYVKIQQQDTEIQQLKVEIKDAIKAYRQLLTKD